MDRIFGDQVSLSYYDAAQTEVQAQFREIINQAQERYWPHPLVLVDDRIVMAGDVDAYRLVSWVEKAINEPGASSEEGA